MPINYVELFLNLYDYALQNMDWYFQSIVNSILNKQGFQFHLVCAGTFNDRFARRYKINSPAVSLGVTFVIPVGVILLHNNFKYTPKDWIEFVTAHELAHICLNHFPIKVFMCEIWRSLPRDLREFWTLLKSIVYIFSTISAKPYKFPEENITAQQELAADEWAVKVLRRKEPALNFLRWIKKQGIIISHISPIGGLPALTISERIKYIEDLAIDYEGS